MPSNISTFQTVDFGAQIAFEVVEQVDRKK